jgi:hypothetical protein
MKDLRERRYRKELIDQISALCDPGSELIPQLDRMAIVSLETILEGKRARLRVH